MKEIWLSTVGTTESFSLMHVWRLTDHQLIWIENRRRELDSDRNAASRSRNASRTSRPGDSDASHKIARRPTGCWADPPIVATGYGGRIVREQMAPTNPIHPALRFLEDILQLKPPGCKQTGA
jgi:hypothetical protein